MLPPGLTPSLQPPTQPVANVKRIPTGTRGSAVRNVAISDFQVWPRSESIPKVPNETNPIIMKIDDQFSCPTAVPEPYSAVQYHALKRNIIPATTTSPKSSAKVILFTMGTMLWRDNNRLQPL